MPKKRNDELFRSQFKSAVQMSFKSDDIPIGNQEAVDTLFADMQPLEFVNEVLFGEDHMIEKYGGVVLTKEWAESFAKAVNSKPGLVYIKGHEDAYIGDGRAIASGYIVGAKVEGSRLLLRNRLLVRNTEEGKELVEQTMREIKAGLLSTSTGDYQIRRYEFDEDKQDFVSYAIESVKNQTNALTEHDMHASDASIIGSNFKLGFYDKDRKFVGVEPNATVSGENDINGGETMTFKERVDAIKTALSSGEGDVSTLARELGIEVLTDEVKAEVARLKGAEDRVGRIDEYITKNEAAMQADFVRLKDAALEKEFGEPAVRGIARELFKLEKGTSAEIDTEIARLKSLESVKNIQTYFASQMNYRSSQNGEEDTNSTANVGTVEA